MVPNVVISQKSVNLDSSCLIALQTKSSVATLLPSVMAQSSIQIPTHCSIIGINTWDEVPSVFDTIESMQSCVELAGVRWNDPEESMHVVSDFLAHVLCMVQLGVVIVKLLESPLN